MSDPTLPVDCAMTVREASGKIDRLRAELAKVRNASHAAGVDGLIDEESFRAQLADKDDVIFCFEAELKTANARIEALEEALESTAKLGGQRIEELKKSYDKLLKDGWMEWKKAGSPGDWTVNTVPKTFQHAIRRVVITEDDRVVYDAEEDDVGCVYIVTPEVMRTEIRPILDGWDRGHFFPEEQIDEAWTAVMQNPSAIIRSAGSALFAIFGIVACPDCGGSGVVSSPYELDAEDCPDCNGHGWVSKPTNKEK